MPWITKSFLEEVEEVVENAYEKMVLDAHLSKKGVEERKKLGSILSRIVALLKI